MIRHARRVCRLLAIAALFAPPSLHAQLHVGALVRKNVLLTTLPPDSLYLQARELVSAHTGQLSTITVRLVDGEPSGALLQHREVFTAFHSRTGGRSPEPYDRAVVAVREDSLFRVLYVAKIDPGLGYVETVDILVPPGSRSEIYFLHVRYVQTSSGAVTQDLLFALDPRNRLVEVPFVRPELDQFLEDGEYLCCGRYTSFDDGLIEQTVFVTRSGRSGITHRIRSRFELEGAFELDSETQQYRPRFRLIATSTGREPTVYPLVPRRQRRRVPAT